MLPPLPATAIGVVGTLAPPTPPGALEPAAVAGLLAIAGAHPVGPGTLPSRQTHPLVCPVAQKLVLAELSGSEPHAANANTHRPSHFTRNRPEPRESTISIGRSSPAPRMQKRTVTAVPAAHLLELKRISKQLGQPYPGDDERFW